ncbi:MAG TPA: outer membrane lipoprotein chaperone LolA [Steroidobacteraceae bacterium]|jgi:chaperone LolA|nr:outer membrane lipoprotein chaperone LolA [Steroidobacteraceae bacterium]
MMLKQCGLCLVLVWMAMLAGPAAAADVPKATGALTAAAPAATASANVSTPLDKYLSDMKTLRTTFLQTLADGQGREIDRSTGTLIVARPGKFSWDIHPQAGDTNKGAGQLMVSDGRNLWFFDRDLEQVTVKPVDAALSATPAMLLSGTVDVRKNFTLSLAGQRDGLDWVLVEPHGTDADFKDALFGFSSGDLKRMILEDKLGQTATILFDHIERNVPVSAQETSFAPPKGADLIGKPQK